MNNSDMQARIDQENTRIKREGGQAFPTPWGSAGLTKREYMATALMGHASLLFGPEDAAAKAVVYADALLLELAK